MGTDSRTVLPPGRCPQCSAIECAAVLDLKSWSISPAGTVIETTIGHRYACQRCACIYSVSPTGVFRHHPQSSPLTPEVRRPLTDDERPDTPEVQHPQRPLPKQRPAV